MFPRNAISPERIAIGQVVLIADGTIQTSAVVITVRGQGGAEATGGGTTAYGAEGTVYYTPTQAETNYTSFVVIASKASCFSASLTVVTTASSTAGQVDVKSIAGIAQTGNDNGADINTLIAGVNVSSISGDTTAADNLELQYDGTGLTGDTYPSTQAQLDGIANVGSAVHRPASSYTLTTGTQSANTFASTEALDGTRHEHTDAAGVLDLEYHFVIGSGTPSSVQVTGYVTGANDDVDVFGYDWVTAGYKQIGNINGSSSTSNSVYSFDLFVDMVGSGANEGKVDIMLGKTAGLTSATIAIDQIFVAFSQGVEGYDNGAVWFNSNASNAGTVVNIDGTARNPVSTSAALLSLLASTGLQKIEVAPASTLTLGGAYEGYEIQGHGSVLALGTQNIGGSVFRGFSNITGTGTTTGSAVFFEDCIFGTASLPPYVAQQCGYGSTVTQVGAGDYTHIDCYSTVAGPGSPTFTRSGAGVATGEYRRFSGGITQSGITGSDTYTIGGELGGVTLNGASGTVEIRGIHKSVTDNRTGTPTLNLDGAIKGVDVASTLADTNELQTDWVNGGRLDNLLDGAASAGDPWTTALPGAYGAGTAGKIVGDNINATISSRATEAKQDTAQTAINALPAATDIVTAGAIATSAGAIVNVDLVDVCTTNTDMRGTDSAATAASLATAQTAIDALTDPYGIKKNTNFSNFEFPMVLTSDHYTAATLKTVTGAVSLDGAAYSAMASTISEIGSGTYNVATLLAADVNADTVTFKFSATDCDDTIIHIITRA